MSMIGGRRLQQRYTKIGAPGPVDPLSAGVIKMREGWWCPIVRAA